MALRRSFGSFLEEAIRSGAVSVSEFTRKNSGFSRPSEREGTKVPQAFKKLFFPLSMKRIFTLVLLAGFALPCSSTFAEKNPPPTTEAVQETSGTQKATAEEAAAMARLLKILEAMRPQTGEVPLGDFAKLALPEGVCFLDAKDSRTVLEDLWGNPPGAVEGVHGMIVKSPASVLEEKAWGIIVTYSKDGYVDDSDAAKIDYDKLLVSMKEGTVESNKERIKQGYGGVELIGWAEVPHYDSLTHKIYWAKELAFEGNGEHTLNYCIRILGRRGVLELNTVAPVSELAEVRESSKKILDGVEFTKGNRYADFNRATDDIASYGIAALVAGGVAKKVGLFKLLLAFALAAKKFLVVGVVAVGAFIARIFKRTE